MTDIAEIYVYIASESNEAIATNYVTKLEEALRPLRDMPAMGSPRTWLAADMRALIYRSHVVYYVQRAPEVVIVRVVHGARDVQAICEEGGFEIE